MPPLQIFQLGASPVHPDVVGRISRYHVALVACDMMDTVDENILPSFLGYKKIPGGAGLLPSTV